jgi:hypothetical protein
MHLTPLLLSLLVGLLRGLIAWGVLHVRSPEDGDGLMGTQDDLLWGTIAAGWPGYCGIH